MAAMQEQLPAHALVADGVFHRPAHFGYCRHCLSYFKTASLSDDAQPLALTSGIAAGIRRRFDSRLATPTR